MATTVSRRASTAPRLPQTYTTRVLAVVRRRYGALLPPPTRFFSIAVPPGAWPLAVREWAARRLGYTLPAGFKVDGTVDGEPLDETPGGRRGRRGDDKPDDDGADPDGVWDFRDRFGLLLIRSPNHGALEPTTYCARTLVAVLAGPRANIAGFTRWVAAEVRRTSREARRVVDLHQCTSEHSAPGGLCVDPATVLLPPGVRDTLLREADLFCDGQAWYAEQGLPWRRGVLLYGTPGNGKTTVARMLASRFFDRGGEAFGYSPCNHCSDEDLRSAFRSAAAAAPALLALEDIDTLQQTQVTRSGLLALLDGAGGAASGVFVVATTNYPEAVDPALAGRAERFDRAIPIPEPDEAARRLYLEPRWRGRAQEPLLVTAVAATAGLSMAALNEVHHFAAMGVREESLPSADELRAFIGSLRRVEASRRDHQWAHGGPLGFNAARGE